MSELLKINIQYSRYISHYRGYIHNSSHESMSLQHFFSELEMSHHKKKLIESSSLFKGEYSMYSFGVSQPWVLFASDNKMSLIWLNGRCKTVAFRAVLSSALALLWSRTPVKMTYFPDLQLCPGGVWAVTQRVRRMFVCGVFDEGQRRFQPFDLSAFTPTPPPYISQYSAFNSELYCFGLCEHLKHEITCNVV